MYKSEIMKSNDQKNCRNQSKGETSDTPGLVNDMEISKVQNFSQKTSNVEFHDKDRCNSVGKRNSIDDKSNQKIPQNFIFESKHVISNNYSMSSMDQDPTLKSTVIQNDLSGNRSLFKPDIGLLTSIVDYNEDMSLKKSFTNKSDFYMDSPWNEQSKPTHCHSQGGNVVNKPNPKSDDNERTKIIMRFNTDS